MPKLYAKRIEDGFNANREPDKKIHVHFISPQFSVYDTDPYALIGEINEFFYENIIMGRSEFQNIIDKLSIRSWYEKN